MKDRDREECLWMVSDDPALCRRVEVELESLHCAVRIITRNQAEECGFWRNTATVPGAVLLDLDDDIDRGVNTLRDIKRAHVRAPLIVASKDLDKEFGAKIVSEGVSYFLLRDFNAVELREVVSGLLKPSRNPVQ